MKCIRKMAVVAAAGMMAVALAGGCSGSSGSSSTPTMKKVFVENGIRADAAKATQSAAWTVTCPSDLKGKVGTEMTCTVVAWPTNGRPASGRITVWVTKVDGKKIIYGEKGEWPT